MSNAQDEIKTAAINRYFELTDAQRTIEQTIEDVNRNESYGPENRKRKTDRLTTTLNLLKQLQRELSDSARINRF